MLPAFAVGERDADGPPVLHDHRPHGVPLAHVDAELPRAVEEDLVEDRPLDLIGIAEGIIRLAAEPEGPGLRVRPPAEGPAVLLREAPPLDLVEDAEHAADAVDCR